MTALITRTRKALEALFEHLLGAITVSLVLIVLWQVASRYILSSPSRWTDECATILLVWMALIGSALGFARKAHPGLDFVAGKLPAGGQAALRATVSLLVLVFAAWVLVWGGAGLAASAFRTGQVMPALQLPRGYFYVPLPVSGVLVMVVAVEAALESIARLRMPEATGE